ncbi:FliM/FliN family flagellar motor C-terminal domain-containing protein [Octadecabacter sp. 1_MG-2023]|uniref:FliM/FliN family flagellar motor switch protein n=1 Tax=unclassified Octadecabacter TaxID=196158 RepID=UPI001C09D47B|nr:MULTISPECIES: FliM/FliN family flagellar motor C-terminal domain-containing protein [unclassified Octadecabacter]MBU2992370.1 FliM/FliN family flagellar motor C-terminal domain-containing protein [Octadecabacter sp. B2R22]MDO6734873.1 FliM/FliN family flagellar motor C-terminal domain-containing protein [Octadecabacter sp. 1_MG-2023]
MDDTPTVPVAHPLHNIPVEVTISVGRARPLVRDLLELGENAVLPLDKRIEDPVDLFVGGRLIARGQLEQVADSETGQLAVRLTEVISTGVSSE